MILGHPKPYSGSYGNPLVHKSKSTALCPHRISSQHKCELLHPTTISKLQAGQKQTLIQDLMALALAQLL